MQYPFIVTGLSMIPRQVQNDLIIERIDLSTTHEEANVVRVQQAYQFIFDAGIRSVCVISNSTYIFVLLAYIYQKLGLQANVFMQVTSSEQNIVDIGLTIKTNKETIPSIAILWHHIMVQ